MTALKVGSLFTARNRAGARGAALIALILAPAYAFAQPVARPPAGNAGADILEEIIVTAQKRAERLQDVPVPVTAVSGEALLDQNQLRAQDFFSSVPGLGLQFMNGRSNLTIRGVTTGPATGNPTVGYTIDDVPYGSSVGIAGLFGAAPDLDPGDLARIEVLRGPQGTLYGASSIGGLVKYVTVKPSTDRLAGTMGAGVQAVSGGHGPGYNLRGNLNIPLSDVFAVRASAFTRRDAGYINNVVTGKRGVNQSDVSGGRLSALWQPSNALSVEMAALYQDTEVDGSSNVDTLLPRRNRQSDHIGAGYSRWKNQIYSAVVNADLGVSELTSVTSYIYNPSVDNVDFSASGLNAALPLIYPVGINPMAALLHQEYNTKKLTQEVRLMTPIGDNVDWLVGAFYTNENSHYMIQALATDPANGTVHGVPILWRDKLEFAEYAGFTDVTVRFTDQFDVQVGARWSSNKQDLRHRQWNFDQPAGLFTDPTSKDHALTYLLTPRFKLSADHMFYGRLATGYRPGGPNAVCNDARVPCQYRSDKTKNYEIGAKGDFYGRLLSYDLSFYHIDWRDIQLTQVAPDATYNYNTNASRARSRGVELSLEARPSDGLTLALWGAWTDATLRAGFSEPSAVYAAAGDRLPYSNRFSARFSVDYESSLTEDMLLLMGGSVSYVGNRKGEFVPTRQEAPLRQTYPSYAQLDLHLGVKSEDWKINLSIQNVTNQRGVTGGGYNNQTTFNRYWLNYVRPRTVGLSFEKSF